MTLFAYLNGSDVGYRVRLNAFGLTSRADGAPGMGGIIFDDPDKTLTVRGWMSIVVKETACTSAPVLFSGYVGPRTYSRSDGTRTYRTGGGRFINTNLVDHNIVAAIRLITGTDGKRPAETHNARLTWLLGSSYMSGLIADTSLIDTSNPRPFEEADYRGQYPDNVLEDIAGPIFRSFFVYLTQPTGGRGMFFDVPTATVSTSTLTVSNVYTDQSATCFPPSIDAELNRDPSEVIAKVRFTYAHGTIIENNTTTRDTFFLDNDLGYRGLQVDNSRVGLESTARSMAQRILTRNSTEKDTITFVVQLPAASVGLIRAGQRLGVRFSHLDGYETLQYARVVMVNYAQAPDTEAVYDVTVELSNSGLSSTGGGGAPAPGDFPLSGCSDVTVVQHKTYQTGSPNGAGSVLSYDAAPAEGNLLVMLITLPGGYASTFTAATGWTQLGSQLETTGGSSVAQRVYTKVAAADESASSTWTLPSSYGAITLYELDADAIAVAASASDTGTTTTGPTLSAVTTAQTLAIAFYAHAGGDHRDAANVTPYSGDYLGSGGFTLIEHYNPGERGVAIGAHNVATKSAAAGETVSVSMLDGSPYNGTWAGFLLFATCTASAGDPPSPGQWVYGETASMAGAVGTLDFPYADGSLKIRVDGVLISPASYTETSPSAGTFTLDWQPDTDETVTVDYQGR